jgi:LacI family transcriptional regulator
VRLVRVDLEAEVHEGFPTLQDLLAGDEPPRAVFASNDLHAMALHQVMMRRGLTLHDVDLVGFDDARLAPFMPLPWTTVAQPKEQIGRRAALILLEMADKGTRHLKQESLPPRLVTR